MDYQTEVSLRRRLFSDFEAYAKKALKIRGKNGRVIPFSFNKVQLYLHQKIEEQRAATGRVRVIILKGRQQGCSTYVQARYYWRVTHGKGLRAFILTHTSEATNNLFEMVERFHNNCPDVVKPQVGASNARELNFSILDSGYKIGTAGTRATGRSQTIQLFHGSEVAFWPHAESHAAGILQAIPDEDGTEIILESTANGMGNFFHRLWQQAEHSQSKYQALFVPWYWQTEYRHSVNGDLQLTDEEEQYKKNYALDDEQMAWRRFKIQELGSQALFKQEYPATPSEAFAGLNNDSLISADAVAAAQIKKVGLEAIGARLGGCDPARFGLDRTAIVFRQGRVVHQLKVLSGLDTMQVVGQCIEAIKEWNLDKLFVDSVGLGAGVIDRLKELGFGSLVVSVQAGASPMNKDRYVNLRAEMWDKMKQWLYDLPVEIPQNQALASDLVTPLYSFDSNGRLKLESKDDIKKRGLISPDLGDALALTFSMAVGPYKKHIWKSNNYLDN